jgi:hypothetical protein
MFTLLYKLLKYVFAILLCTTLLLGAAWSLPQTRDDVVALKNYVEKQFDLDIYEKMLILEQVWNKYRRIDRDGMR